MAEVHKEMWKEKKIQQQSELPSDPNPNPPPPQDPEGWLRLIKHAAVCYLFINLLFDVSQRAVRVAPEITEGLAITVRPREDAPLCSRRKVQGDTGRGGGAFCSDFSLPL